MKKDLAFSWCEWEDFYNAQNLKYKDEARKLFINELGFEPSIRASMDFELKIRKQLRKVDEGRLDREIVDSNVELFSNVIRGLIKDYIPEQNHLLKD